MSKCVRWTEEEMALLTSTYPTLGTAGNEISKYFPNRTLVSISLKARSLGLNVLNARNKLKTTEEYQKGLYSRGICVIGEYINNDTKIEHGCVVCDNIWEARPGDISRGGGCPVCNKGFGHYNSNNAPETASIYIVRIKLPENVTFIKIGVTCVYMSSRLSKLKSETKATDVEILKVYESTGEAILKIEAKILSDRNIPKLISPIVFHGYTEIYPETSLNALISALDFEIDLNN